MNFQSYLAALCGAGLVQGSQLALVREETDRHTTQVLNKRERERERERESEREREREREMVFLVCSLQVVLDGVFQRLNVGASNHLRRWRECKRERESKSHVRGQRTSFLVIGFKLFIQREREREREREIHTDTDTDTHTRQRTASLPLSFAHLEQPRAFSVRLPRMCSLTIECVPLL